jgi:hypothetical protein
MIVLSNVSQSPEIMLQRYHAGYSLIQHSLTMAKHSETLSTHLFDPSLIVVPLTQNGSLKLLPFFIHSLCCAFFDL